MTNSASKNPIPPGDPSLALRAYAMLLTCTCLWAGNAIAGKLAVGHVAPFTLTLARWVFAVLVLLPFAFRHLRRDWPKIASQLRFLLMLGALGFALFNNLMYSALQYTSAINVAIEQAALPLIVFAFNFLLYRIATTPWQMVGFAITLAGVVVAVTRGDMETLTTLNFNFGDLLMMAAVALYGIYSVLLKKKADIHWMSFIIVLASGAILTATPFFLYEFFSPGYHLPDASGWWVILYAALGPSILSQVFWMMGLGIVGANRGGVFINFVPVIATLFAVLLLGEQFHPYHAIAMALVLSGVVISQRSKG